MRTLIYKRTHNGDPHPETDGIFGIHECMKSVREWRMGAIIGVGGIGREPQQEGIVRVATINDGQAFTVVDGAKRKAKSLAMGR